MEGALRPGPWHSACWQLPDADLSFPCLRSGSCGVRHRDWRDQPQRPSWARPSWPRVSDHRVTGPFVSLLVSVQTSCHGHVKRGGGTDTQSPGGAHSRVWVTHLFQVRGDPQGTVSTQGMWEGFRRAPPIHSVCPLCLPSLSLSPVFWFLPLLSSPSSALRPISRWPKAGHRQSLP